MSSPFEMRGCAGRRVLSVVLRGAEGERVRRVVHEGQFVHAYLLTDAPGEKAAPLDDLLARQRAGENAQQRCRHPPVQDGRDLRAPRLLRSEEPCRPVHGIGGGGFEIEVAGRSPTE